LNLKKLVESVEALFIQWVTQKNIFIVIYFGMHLFLVIPTQLHLHYLNSWFQIDIIFNTSPQIFDNSIASEVNEDVW